ncbi:hypothetical protein K0T92_18295 [Paenibacillus oenotherae]|uniref:Uncharacterized protein n=1 Tax=Paenibacillus oenotherae TaxID=1435645 RepID=A0ABS7D9Q3_9BACL|nr:hypothetical protein [Paenibacillus oenotherae]MBW7476672.1 hypothetical protein [Paenibacillus oenotherae]
MLHTIHLFKKINTSMYYALHRTFLKMAKANKVRFYEKHRQAYCELLKDRGINLILTRVEFEDGLSYSAIEIIMNPMRLLNHDDFVNLAELQHSSEIKKEFTKVFEPIKKIFHQDRKNKDLKFIFHKLDSYKFKRVDLAINIETEHIEYYMKLIRRGNIPDGFIQASNYNKTSKRTKPLEDSFYLKGIKKNASVTINCYNKGKQLKNKKLPGAKDAKWTIRFEVQCEYNKLYPLTRNEGNNLSFFLSDELSEDILGFYFKKTVGFGDYYTLSNARNIIQSQEGLGQKKKDALLDTLDMVNQKRGIWKARKHVDDKKSFDTRIKALHELNVNPVTIPANWKIDHLPCLLKLGHEE